MAIFSALLAFLVAPDFRSAQRWPRGLYRQIIRSGAGELSQCDRIVRLRQGDLASTFSLRRLTMRCTQARSSPELLKPLLDSKLGDARDLIGVKVESDDPLLPVLNNLLARSLRLDFAKGTGGVAAERVANPIHDVLASSCDFRRDAVSARDYGEPLERLMR